MTDRSSIIEAHPIVPFLESKGIMIRAGKTNRCAQREHRPMHYCVEIWPETGKWHCHDCGEGGTVIDWVMLADGVPFAEAAARLGGEPRPALRSEAILRRDMTPANGNSDTGHAARAETATQAEDPKTKPERAPTTPRKEVRRYPYTDAKGNVLFKVVRYEPKDFRQCRPDGNGGVAWNLEGVQRVLFNLPKVIAADIVFLCEGEKDAETIEAMGLTGTTNVGGAKKWEPSYTPYFRNKELVILPDNDEAGQAHLELVSKALERVAKSMRIVKMPEGIKDISEFVATFQYPEEAKAEFISMCEDAECLYQGQSIPVFSIKEMEVRYKEYVKISEKHQFQIGHWLPTLLHSVRPLVPGELVTILAGTGVGKTILLQNIALHARVETLFFELELPDTLTFERFVALATDSSGAHVESTYRMNGSKDWGKYLDHVQVCPKSRVSISDIPKIINGASLKTNVRPVLVLIDYIQLIRGEGRSRYEDISYIAEELKVIAKETGTIIVIASQIGRKQKKDDADEKKEVRLTDGKESGSIENSSGLVLGAWRDATDDCRMWLRVLKNTKGRPGKTIPCRIKDSLRVVEESNIPEPEPENQKRK